jgi:diguanylate cyclase (GGDEF)-like protein/PAS domain S-box-containing protein
MKMAWIGLLDAATGRVRPAASFGSGLAYLDGIHITVDAADAHGRGPVGTALREDRPVWNQDFLNDPLTAPWRERAVQYAWGAVASLPLRRGGQVIGTFNLYAGDANAFDEDARRLLEEMAADISYALDGFDREANVKLAAEVFEQGKEGIMITDISGRIMRVNRAFSEISGYSEAEALGQGASLLSSGRQGKEFYREMWEAIDATGHWQGEIWNRRKDGHVYPEWLAISRVLGTDGKPSHYVGIFSDITRHKEAEARIQRLAHFDALTGLPNRALLHDRARHALSMAQRSREQLAVLFLDLDHFKNINDTLGHRIGDELLVEVGNRMVAATRKEDTVSRQGGDEFVVILPGTDADGAAYVARKLIEMIAHSVKVEQYELVVTPSIGIAVYPSDGEDFETLSRSADTAMYRAKQDGRNTFRFFTPEMQEHSARSLRLEGGLRHALARGELQLFYQPQLSLVDGRVVGAEALLRWRNPDLGEVMPAEFISVAEDSGLILPIGEWVLRTAIQQMKAWMDAGLAPMIMAINLSAAQFRHAHLPELVTRALADEGLAPEFLELELTESVAMDDPLAAIAVMDELRACGVRMSIDDFGTGYSSLSYLKRFQVYKLKIDQSFVSDLSADPESKAIVRAVISLADSLGMRTIAEGVETEEQLNFLREQGCHEVQGYYYSRPLLPEDFTQFVRGRS